MTKCPHKIILGNDEWCSLYNGLCSHVSECKYKELEI